MDQTLQFVIPALMGVESTVAWELKKLGLSNVRAENGRVLCQGGPADIPRMNLNLRCGARVLLSLGTFRAQTFEELFQGVLSVPWEDYIPREGRFPVKGYSISSTLHSVPACQSIVKKALCTRLGRAYGLETLPETGAVFHFEGFRRRPAGHLRGQPLQAGLPGAEHGRAPAGDAGGGVGAAVPL